MSDNIMDCHVFLYRSNNWIYDTTKDIKFIAKHPKCVALNRREVLDKFGTVLEFINFINKASLKDVSLVFTYGNLKYLKHV